MQIENIQIAIVVSLFNSEITNPLLQGATDRLLNAGLALSQITIIKVPGAIEIPLIAKQLAKKNCYAAIICLGAVIRGETDHYDYVCNQVSQGCQQVMLQHDVPIIFGILTTNTLDQALDRIGGKMGHKGIESAEAALHMAEVMAGLG